MFRCPCCAKVWKLPLTNNHSLLMRQNMDKLEIVSEPVSLYSKFIPVEIDLMAIAEKLAELGLAFDFKGDNFLQCPSCDTYSTFTEWHKAWNFPGDFFDADQLCSCGGELWWDRHPYKPVYAHVCEKCGWVKPRAVLSGAVKDPRE